MRKSMLILFGSETQGTAHNLALQLCHQAKCRHFSTRVMAMDAYDRSCLPEEEIVIFICSTCGIGQEPSNMSKFWRFLLRKNIPHSLFSSIQYAVFGLGDSSYEHFSFVGKKLDRRMEQLSATRLIERGDGDDQHDYLELNVFTLLLD